MNTTENPANIHKEFHLAQQLNQAKALLRSVSRIVETIELCREGIWSEHKPALDRILRDFDLLGFELSPDTLSEIRQSNSETFE